MEDIPEAGWGQASKKPVKGLTGLGMALCSGVEVGRSLLLM